jgi:EAL domain-containing protein (putative c-di-GMP-specific phosphodiesterase class I)
VGFFLDKTHKKVARLNYKPRKKVNINKITSIMGNNDYGVCYEPIVDLKTMEIVGYEGLSRFRIGKELISPMNFFKSLHDNIELFFYVETIVKKFQLQNRPKGKKLFLNLDPDIAIDPTHISFWVKLF